MNRLPCLFLLLIAAAPPAAHANLDLYIHDRYLKYSNPIQAEICSSCSEEDGCVMEREILVQDHCLATGLGSSQSFQGRSSNVFSLCRQDFADESCTSLEKDCDRAFPMDTCLFNMQTTRLPDYCIESTEPTVDYLTPLVRLQLYFDLDRCLNNEGPIDVLQIVDPDLCQYASLTLDGGNRITASKVSYCKDDMLVSQLFSDKLCQTQEGLGETVEIETEATCTPTGSGSYFRTDTCSEPTVYCKDLTDTLIGTKLVRPGPSEPIVILPPSDPVVSNNESGASLRFQRVLWAGVVTLLMSSSLW